LSLYGGGGLRGALLRFLSILGSGLYFLTILFLANEAQEFFSGRYFVFLGQRGAPLNDWFKFEFIRRYAKRRMNSNYEIRSFYYESSVPGYKNYSKKSQHTLQHATGIGIYAIGSGAAPLHFIKSCNDFIYCLMVYMYMIDI
jgi:hypothetical protein